MNTIKWRKGLEIKLDVDYSIKRILFDWTDWLNEIGSDTILSSIIDSTTDLIITGITDTASTVEFIVEADPTAVVGEKGSATCVITTANAQSEPRTIYFDLVNDL